ncbi:response regulator [Sphingomicrobium astaxanthinifaciens]|uniref:response regulator n=1 Tax=Sphingomicrobium astaxanthinifaciens TaxID=1227949 RepID=UPI001FCB37C6|nr:response regulator [Sphingomicrobium astaxanthinifaciens]MCJ7422238.1 response regulator [Sphingomicrobium astaxanthinifaciens]
MTDSRTILVVEDEPLIAMMLEDFLETLGHECAGACETVAEALEAVEKGGFDMAILDVNLAGEPVWPVAEALRARGIPFALATGGHLSAPPADFETTPTLAKPFTIDRVEPVIAATLGQ